MRITIKIIIFSCCFLFNSYGFAGPWFTGPILAPAGHTIPKGHTNLELYGLDVSSNGYYDNRGNLIHSPLYKSFVTNPIVTHGFTDWLDVQVTLPYTFNATRGINYNRLADVSGALGIQLWEQNNSPQKADLRLLVQETFPTGKYELLNPAFLGTDSTGLGSYQTQLGLDFQYLKEVFPTHYLRTRIILYHIFYSSVKVFGISSYGGTPESEGKINAGQENDLDLAFEFTLTQHWVAVMEAAYASGDSTIFNGSLDVGNLNGTTNLLGSYHQASIAPAMEYNFNENIGLIGGVWFPVHGKNTPYFRTYVLALNIFW